MKEKLKSLPHLSTVKKNRTLECPHVISIPKTNYHYFLTSKKSSSNARWWTSVCKIKGPSPFPYYHPFFS
jgi:hypothetical protein